MNCCVTGHRPKGFPFPRDPMCEDYRNYLNELRKEITRLAHSGYTHFITGMADGADLDFAHCVLELRTQIPSVTIEAVLPYPIVPARRKTAYQQERDFILSQCDHIHETSPYYHKGCMQKRNVYMVDHSDMVLAIWNGIESGGTWNTIQYARKQRKKLLYLMLETENTSHR